MKTFFGPAPIRKLTLSLLLALPVSSVAAQSQQSQEAGPPPHHEADSEPVVGKSSQSATAEPAGVFKPIEISEGVTLQFGGFAKVDYMQDLDPIGNPDQFKVSSIPVETDPDSALGGSNNVSARQTRLSFDVRADEAAGGLHVYVEGDFFGSGNAFRMRHGYGEWGGLLAGQTWTTFQDISARPFTLDYEGPDSEVFVRQPMIRFTGTPSENLEWSVAVEDPDSQLTVASDFAGSGRNELPDIPARVRIKSKRGHLQVAGLLRQIRFVSDDGSVKESTTGYGINVSGKAMVLKRGAIMGHVGYGSGIGRYIESFGGESSDGVLRSDGTLDALDAWAFVLGYSHPWSERWHSTFSGGQAGVDNDPAQPSSSIKSARSAHANLVYSPNRPVLIGAEVIWGQRENHDGAKGEAVRLQFSIQYKFR